MKVGPPVWTIR